MERMSICKEKTPLKLTTVAPIVMSISLSNSLSGFFVEMLDRIGTSPELWPGPVWPIQDCIMLKRTTSNGHRIVYLTYPEDIDGTYDVVWLNDDKGI